MKRIFFFVAFIAFFFSCTTRAVEPTRTSRHTIDTLFQQKTILFGPVMDSVCDSLYPGFYTIAVDSIMIARKLEMNILVK